MTGRWTRFFALPRFAWDRLFQQRLVVVLLVSSMIWPLFCAVYIYLLNHASLLAELGVGGIGSALKIDGTFFLIFMRVQSVLGLLLAAISGPGLIAPDLGNNALPLYFSRPLTRPDYVAAKMTVLVAMLSMTTWIPGLLLFGMQASMAPGSWFTSNWRLGAGVFGGFALWVCLVSLVALASSAYVKWAKVAGALVLAFFFISAGVAAMVNQVLRVTWGWILSPSWAMNRVWYAALGVDPPEGPGPLACTVVLLLLTGLLVLVLERKLRPVEVIS